MALAPMAHRLGWLGALINRLLGRAPWESAIDLDPDKAYPRLRLDERECGPPPPGAVEDLARDGRVFLSPGTYEFVVQSFCLEGGKLGPGSDAGYVPTPLSGPMSGVLRRLLRAAAGEGETPQGKVQSLVWAMTSHTGYYDWAPEMRETAERLLDERDLRTLGKSYWRLIPQPLRELVTRPLRALLEQLPGWREAEQAAARWRGVLADARATYEDLERAFLRLGPPSGAGGSQDGEWSLVPGGCFIRILPESYSRTRIQVDVPAPAEVLIERDGLSRITRLLMDAEPRVTLEYDDRPGSDSLDLGEGRSLPVWRFDLAGLDAGSEEGEEGAQIAGWLARDARQLAGLDPIRYPRLTGRIKAAQAAVQFVAQLRQSTGARSESTGEPSEKQRGSGDPFKDITDLQHYLAGVEAVLEDFRDFPSYQEKLKWLREHFRRLRRAYEYAAAMLRGLTGEAEPPPPGHPGRPGGWFGPGGFMGLPDDPGNQALGFRA